MNHEILGLLRRGLAGLVCLVLVTASLEGAGLSLCIHNNTGANARVQFTGGNVDFADTFGPGTTWKYLGDMAIPVTFTVAGINGASGSGSFTFNAAHTDIDGFTVGGASGQGDPPPQWTVKFRLPENKTAYPVTYEWNLPGGGKDHLTVAPGAGGAEAPIDVTITTDGQPYTVNVTSTSYTADGIPVSLASASIPPESSSWNQDGGGPPTVGSAPAGSTPPTNAPSSNIPFPGDTTDLAKEASMQMGFNSLRETSAGGFNNTISAIGKGNSMLATLAANSSGYLVINGTLVSIQSVLSALQGNVQALQAVTSQINGNIGTANTTLAGIKTAADSTAANTAAASVKLDGLGGKLDTVANYAGQLTTSANLANTALAGIKTDGAAMAASSEAALGKLDGVGGKIDGVGSKLDGVGGKLDSMSGIAGQINTGVGLANTALAGIKSDSAAISWSGAAALGKLDVVGGKLDTLSAGQASLLAKVGEAYAELGIINNTALAGNAKAAEIKSDTGLLTVRAQNIQDAANLANDRLFKIDSDINTVGGHLQAPLDSINAALPAMAGRLDQITTAAQEVNNKLAEYLPKLSLIEETLRNDIKPKIKDIADNTKEATNYMNYISEKLGAVTNLMGGITNMQGKQWDTLKDISTNTYHPAPEAPETVLGRQLAKGAAATLEGKEALNGLGAAASGIGGNRSVGGSEGSWLVGMAGYHLDLNPMHVEGVGELAAWFRNAVAWLAALACVFICWRVMEEKMHAGAAAQQGRSQLNIPVLGTIAAEVIAVASIVLLAALPALFAAWVYMSTGQAPWAAIMGNPFGETGGAVGQGLWLLNQWIPVGLILGYVAIILSFKLYAMALFWFVTGSIRALAG